MNGSLKYLIISLLFFPIVVNASNFSDITYHDANITFSIDESEWKETNLTEEREYIDRKWESQCGLIVTGTTDIYSTLSEEELDGLSREYFNYKNYLPLQSIINEWEYNVSEYSLQKYKMEFINIIGTAEMYGIDIEYETYITINNGYLFSIQYFKNSTNGATLSGTCSNGIDEIVKTAKSTINVKSIGGDSMDYGTIDWVSVILGVLLTFVCYTAYPFITTKVKRKKYNKKECQKMAMWNSIIVGFIFCVITAIFDSNATWSAGPAFLYYWINKDLWVDKSKKKKSNQRKKEESYKCDNCGAMVSELDNKCPTCGLLFENVIEPKETTQFKCDNCGAIVGESDIKCFNCGESFIEENEVEINNVSTKENFDDKYDKLIKLKDLYDKKILSDEEFEHEKRIILESNK